MKDIFKSFLSLFFVALFFNVMMPIPFGVLMMLLNGFGFEDEAFPIGALCVSAGCFIWAVWQIIPDIAAYNFLKEHKISVDDIRNYRRELSSRYRGTIKESLEKASNGNL